MRHSLRVVLACSILLGASISPALGATVQDLIKLKAAGLSDEILIALIESDGSVFHLKADDVIAIRKEGLSEKVIMAMLMTAVKRAPAPVVSRPVSASTPAPPSDAAVTPPVVQVYEPPGAAPEQNVQTTIPPPVVINVTQKVEQRVEQPRGRDDSRAMYATYPYYPYYYPVAVAIRPTVPVKAPDPVYWGFGGQRRPDTWKDK